jgi:hypothetical protein
LIMMMRTTLPFALALAGFALAPIAAHADVPNCEPPSVAIVSPEDGATFEGNPAEVTVKVSVGDGEALRSLSVATDGTEAASMSISDNGTFDLAVELAPGAHTLQATAQDDCGGPGRSDQVSVTVTEPAGGDDGHSHDDADDGHSHDDDGGGDKGGDKDDGGCAVSRTPNRTLVGLSAFLLAVFGAWRLRRGQKPAA